MMWILNNSSVLDIKFDTANEGKNKSKYTSMEKVDDTFLTAGGERKD